ncbi:hypothetical protein HK102_001110 [Quaeritorhiza haematococci]|nr:hypothetical protein HK102_001110 [Quaeritorhiza haematococci]
MGRKQPRWLEDPFNPSPRKSSDTARSVQLTRVCRSFLSAIYGSPVFWKHITFPVNFLCTCHRKWTARPEKHRVTDSAVEALITNLRNHGTLDAVQVFNISKTSLTEAVLFGVVMACPNIAVLRASLCENVDVCVLRDLFRRVLENKEESVAALLVPKFENFGVMDVVDCGAEGDNPFSVCSSRIVKKRTYRAVEELQDIIRALQRSPHHDQDNISTVTTESDPDFEFDMEFVPCSSCKPFTN